jgi:nucleoside-diphosphate-sugar epimerase
MKASRLLVTGANGFLGSEIIREAIREGLQVRGTDLHAAPRSKEFAYYQGNILQSESLGQAMRDMDCVIHTAGLAHIFDKSQASHAPYRLVNAEGTAKVAQMAQKMGVEHFVLISSVSVYGRSVFPADESVSPEPVGAYADSKWEAEKLACKIAKAEGMRLTILRLATLYGEEDPGNVARLMRSMDSGRFIWVGNGTNRKSLLYRGDAARACLRVLETGGTSQLGTYNVSAPPCTMREVVEGLAEALGRRIPKWRIPANFARMYARLVESTPTRTGRLGSLGTTMTKWLAEDSYSGDLFEKTYQFKTQVGLLEGLSREVSWYRNT